MNARDNSDAQYGGPNVEPIRAPIRRLAKDVRRVGASEPARELKTLSFVYIVKVAISVVIVAFVTGRAVYRHKMLSFFAGMFGNVRIARVMYASS